MILFNLNPSMQGDWTICQALRPLLIGVIFFSGAAAQRGLCPLSRSFLITHNDAPQSIELLWTSDQLVAETSTWQHTQQTNIHDPGGIRTIGENIRQNFL
jgi:hypothetical protein